MKKKMGVGSFYKSSHLYQKSSTVLSSHLFRQDLEWQDVTISLDFSVNTCKLIKTKHEFILTKTLNAKIKKFK